MLWGSKLNFGEHLKNIVHKGKKSSGLLTQFSDFSV